MELLRLLILFAVYLNSVLGAPCADGFCATVTCRELDENCDLLLQNATRCGCCTICIKHIEENSGCYPLSVSDVGVSRKHCAPQTTCVNNICQKKNTMCLNEVNNYEKDSKAGWLHLGRRKPKCDNEGKYFRKQCRPGSMCYCVDSDGNRIFGETNDNSKDDVGCACSRIYYDLKTITEGTSLNNWVEDPNRLRHFFHCTETGDFDRLQCIDDKCFCINTTLHLDSIIRPKKEFRILHCYNPDLHSEEFFRPCEQELSRALAYKEKQMSQSKTLIGLDIPQCDLDGTFAPKQCKEDRCFCSDKEGNQIDSFSAIRYTQEDEEMKCECARENLFLKKFMLAKDMACDSLGNYEPLQCLGGNCYCVDKFSGIQMGKEFDRQQAVSKKCNNI